VSLSIDAAKGWCRVTDRSVSGTADDATGVESADMEARRWLRSVEAAAVAGMIYAITAISALVLLARFPSLDLPEQQLTAWFDDSGHRLLLVLGLNLAAISSIAFLWFIAVIRRRLGEQEDQFFATVFLGSGIVYIALWLVSAAAIAAPAIVIALPDAGVVSAPSISLAKGVGAGLLLVVAPRIQAVFILTVSNLIFRLGVLPRWLAVFGLVTGLVMFFVPLVSRPIGIALPIWAFVVSTVILLDKSARRNVVRP
jgi:hypothetical protein